MSGVEVVSFVLAGFPLIISGLEHCQKGLKPVRTFLKYRQELVALHAFITAEYAKFKNSVDLLLQPLVPPAELHYLITEPGKISWDAPHLKASLRRRLGPSEEAFYNALQVVETSVKELKAALQSKDYLDRLHYCFVGSSKRDSTKARLQQGNNDLQSFVIAAKRLGDARERRSILGLDAGIKRKELCELHASLSQDPWRCSCHQHAIHLDIGSVNNMSKTDGKNGASAEVIIAVEVVRSQPPKAKCSVPTIAVALAPSSDGPSNLDNESRSFFQADPLARPSSIPSRTSVTSRTTGNIISQNMERETTPNRLVKKKKAVAFAQRPQTPSPRVSPPALRNDRLSLKITKICAVLSNPVTMRDCVGYLETTNRNRMHVYALPNHYHRSVTKEKPALSLAKALGVSAPPYPSQACNLRRPALLSTRVRLRLASAIAFSYPQLESTPWLQSSLSKWDVCFMGSNRSANAVNVIDFDAPMISQRFGPACSRKTSCRSTAASDSRNAMSKVLAVINQPRTEGLFALGKLLIELAFNAPLEDLYDNEDKDRGEVFEFTDYLAVGRLLPGIYEEHGYLYGEAVRRCIEGVDVREKAIENPEFRKAFLRDIFQPLRDTSEFFSGKPG